MLCQFLASEKEMVEWVELTTKVRFVMDLAFGF